MFKWLKAFVIFPFMMIICLLVSMKVAASEEAKITDVLVSMKNGDLLVVAKLQGCFTPKIESAILAGIPTTFTFIIDLYEERPFWFDRRIKTVSEVKTIKYDLLKKIFYVTIGHATEPLTFQDFESAKRAMSEYNITIPASDILRKTNNSAYYVKMKAQMDKIKLPLRLEMIFVFVSLWDFETAWYRYPVKF
ncbi:MAG TPA: DUF4390 domain-containing protein [Syntrophales bacterium]|nr:DUF4390 domain-containing protein [Syntrophales bacterium]HOL59549.1 DUF4390 domain-containing protein [Syntrophales bacterium]HPO35639.1 DUF4390 domain-containing protein [Syntrophales bacterium]